MPLPTSMQDLSITPASNSPAGGDPVGTSLDNYLREIQAIIRRTNAKGADIASASTTDIGAATGEFVTVTGTTTITALGTIDAGIVRTVHFSGALTITHNATSLILPGGINYTTVAGDVLAFRSLGSGNWRCVGVTRASSGLSTPIQVSTVAAMKALTGLADGALVKPAGYYVAGDYDMPLYRYDSGSSATNNGGTVISPDSGGGRFLAPTSLTLKPKMFGAKADGVTNDTTAVAACLSALPTNGAMDFEGGSYLLTSATLSKSSVANLKIKGSGALITESSPTGDTFTFTSCDNIEIYGFTCEGGETQAEWQADSPTVRRRFFKVATSTRPKIHDIAGSGKRNCVVLDDCTRGVVYNVDHTGFLQNVSSGAVSGANDLCTVELRDGRHNKAYCCHGENVGSVVLVTLDGEAPTIYDITGKEVHDNVVYVSSGLRARIWGVDGVNVVGNFVKTRGKQNIAFGNTGSNCSGSAFIQTGNGTSVDSIGANGHGSIMAFNSAELIAQDGVTIGAQDGFYPRDFVTAFNTFDQLTGTGGYAAIRAAQIQGGVYAFNYVNDTDTTLAYEISKPSGGSKTESVMFFGNGSQTHNGSSEMMSINDIQKSIVAYNYGDNGTEFLIHGRRCDSSIFSGNLNQLAVRAVHFDTTEVCSTNFVFGNYGTTGGTSMGANGNAIGQNMTNGTASGVGATPAAVGLVTVSGGNAYISVATSSSADWKVAT